MSCGLSRGQQVQWPADTKENDMPQQKATVEATMVNVPGATLYVEVRGSGPVLLCITGGPSDAGMFADLAGRLADRYTVVGRA
jgi:hypothetical protein